jgi:hypothetical protein
MEPTARVEFDLRLQLPNHALFIGASQSGKTTLAIHLLTNPHIFHPKPSKILFYYDQFQDTYLEAKAKLAKLDVELQLIQGISSLSLDNFTVQAGQTVLLVDDFSEETSSSKEIARIATNGRHKNLSLWCVWHSLYSPHPASRVITQNARLFFFLPSLRLESQLRTFGSQMGLKNRLLAAYKSMAEDYDAKHRYVLVDAGPRTPDLMRIRSQIDNLLMQYCFF